MYWLNHTGKSVTSEEQKPEISMALGFFHSVSPLSRYSRFIFSFDKLPFPEAWKSTLWHLLDSHRQESHRERSSFLSGSRLGRIQLGLPGWGGLLGLDAPTQISWGMEVPAVCGTYGAPVRRGECLLCRRRAACSRGLESLCWKQPLQRDLPFLS